MPFFNFLKSNARWLAAGGLLTLMSSFGQTFFISVFGGAIRDEFGLSHGAWGGIYSLGTTAAAVVMIWAGGLTDIFRVRVLGSLTFALLALSCVAMALVPGAWALPGVIFLLRLSGQGMSSHIGSVAMARWFVATRGRAIAIASLGFSIGEALLPLIFVALLVQFGWRPLWGVSAGVVLLAIPLLIWLLQTERTPQSVAQTTQSAGMNNRHWARLEVLRNPLFWLVVPAILGPSAFLTALFFHQVHLAEIKGWTHVSLVALFPFFTGATVLAMIVTGWAIDRFGTARLMPYYLLPMAVGFALMAAAGSLMAGGFALMVVAVTVGANTTLPAAFWAEFYGTRFIGGIKAMAAAVMVLGSAIGPGLTGWLIDSGIGFEAQMLGFSAYFIVAAGAVALGVARARRLLPLAP